MKTKHLCSGIIICSFLMVNLHGQKPGISDTANLQGIAPSNSTYIDDIHAKTDELCGNLSGMLEKGIYHVGCDITIPQNDTLILKPGVRLLFGNDLKFTIKGTLMAQGTKLDSIVFTSSDSGIFWNGISIRDGGKALFEYGKLNSCRATHIVNVTKGACFMEHVEMTHSIIMAYGSAMIKSNNSTLTLEDVKIVNNQATDEANTGFMLEESQVRIKNSLIGHNNNMHHFINADYSGVSVYNTVLHNINTALKPALLDFYNCQVAFRNNTVYFEKQHNGSHTNTLYLSGDGNQNIEITNSILHGIDSVVLWLNNDQPDVAVMQHNIFTTSRMNADRGPSVFTNQQTDYFKNVTTNANNDSIDGYHNIIKLPGFMDPQRGDLRLQSASPCIDAGKNDSLGFHYDLAGHSRIVDGNGDGLALVDLGAYEYQRLSPADTLLSVKGSVFAGDTLLTRGTVQAFKVTPNHTIPVSFCYLKKDGSYNLTNLTPGNYFIYAMPEPASQSHYWPTYYVNKTTWEKADSIRIIGAAFNVNIQLQAKVYAENKGEGSISGYVVFEDSASYEKGFYDNIGFNDTVGFTSTEAVNNCAANIPVVLFCGDTLFDWQLSNQRGFFEFEGLPEGRYSIQGEKAGYHVTNQTSLNLSSTGRQINDVRIVIREHDIVSINTEKMFYKEIKAYPNPFREEIKVDLPYTGSSNLQIRIYDIAGNLVGINTFNNKEGKNTITLKTGNLQNGLYLIKVIANDNKYRLFKMIKQ